MTNFKRVTFFIFLLIFVLAKNSIAKSVNTQQAKFVHGEVIIKLKKIVKQNAISIDNSDKMDSGIHLLKKINKKDGIRQVEQVFKKANKPRKQSLKRSKAKFG